MAQAEPTNAGSHEGTAERWDYMLRPIPQPALRATSSAERDESSLANVSREWSKCEMRSRFTPGRALRSPVDRPRRPSDGWR